MERSIGVDQIEKVQHEKKKVLGVTGGVGAGKSTVLAYLRDRYGARVIQADEVGRMLQTPGHDCYDQIVEAFGVEVVDAQGNLRRELLAAKVFDDAKALRRLNDIVHPAVKKYIVQKIEEENNEGLATFVVLEAALLLEAGYDDICDEVWYIYAGEKTRVARLMQSRGYSQEKARDIMANQLSDEEFRRRCKFIIDNDSDFMENTFGQIDKGLMEHGFLQHCQRQ